MDLIIFLFSFPQFLPCFLPSAGFGCCSSFTRVLRSELGLFIWDSLFSQRNTWCRKVPLTRGFPFHFHSFDVVLGRSGRFLPDLQVTEQHAARVPSVPGFLLSSPC